MRDEGKRRKSAGRMVVASVAVVVLSAALTLPTSGAFAATTAVSTIYNTATNTVNGSVAASADAPGGAKTGTAKPGDTLKWVVSSQNNTSAPASVDLKDVTGSAGSYVPGSLQLPPNMDAVGSLTPQYSVNGGATWTAGTPPAGANALGYTGTLVPQATTNLSTRFPSPVGVVLATAGGDGYNAVVHGGLTYAAFHHNAGPLLFCGQQSGATCPGWPTNSNAQFWSPTVGTPIGGARPNFISSWQNGTWISGDKLFWLTGPTDASSVGTGCLDLSPATPVSCGYSVLANNPVTSTGWAQIASSGVAASNGRIYAVATANTVGGVGEWDILCIDPATGTGCGVLPIMTGVTSGQAPQATAFGNRVFASVQQTPTSPWQTYCYVAGGALCSGSWPVTTSTSAALGGNVFAPVLSTTGVLTGICTIRNGAGSSLECWDLAGAPLATNPYTGTGAFYNVATNTSGDVFQVGAKVYPSSGNSILCLDFGAYTGTGAVPVCSGFTPPTNNKNYTVRDASSIAPNCLVADGDAGQITFFNGLTGGACASASGPQSMRVSPLMSYCGSGSAGFTGWGALTLPGLAAGSYANSTVTLRDQNNTVISGFSGVSLAPGGSLDLSSIPTTVTSITATVTVNGVNDPVGVTSGQIQVTWSGAPPEMCFQTIAPPVACDAATPTTLSNTANVVTVSASGSDSPGGNTTGATRFTVQADPSQCGLTMTKTSSPQSARPGDVVTYTIVVRNTGTQAYDSASFADDLTDVLKDATYNNDQTATAGTVSYASPTVSWSGPLAAGASATITYTATVKSPDPGDHSMANTVVSPTIGSNCASGSTDPACTAIVPISDLTVTKTADSSGVRSPAQVGDTVTYAFTAENTGQTTLTGVAITDVHPGLSALTYSWPGVAGTLQVGQTVTATATYQLTQGDVDDGIVTNSATVSGSPPTGPPVTSTPSGAQVPLGQSSQLVFTKTADASGVFSPARPGDVIAYTFVATNDGNTTLTGVSITDPLPGLPALSYTWPGVAGVLQPGQSATATAVYTVTQAGIDAGHVANTATATGRTPGGAAVAPPPSSTDTPLTQGPGLVLVKTADASAVTVPAQAGQRVFYSFNATNTGNVTLTGVSIADPLPGLSALVYSWPGAQGVLKPGQAVTATASYALTQADVDAGHAANTATADGSSPSGPVLTPPSSTTDTPLQSDPGLSLTKTADSSAVGTPAAVGDTIVFSLTATNTGNVTLTNVSIADQLAGLSGLIYTWPGAAGVLEPGQSVPATAAYQLTQQDIDAGQVVNAATAAGTPPSGPAVATPVATVTVPMGASPSMTFSKTADSSALQSPPVAGDVITYTFRATNTGNVTLTGVDITDTLPGLSALTYTWPGAPGTLNPGQEVTATATYAVTQPNIDSGHISNSAITTGTPPAGPDVTPPPAVTDTPLDTNPGLTLVKSADLSVLNSPTRVGDQITYHFVATNTGNVTLTGVSVADPLPGLSGISYTWPGTPGTLSPGQAVDAAAIYAVTQADIDAGHVVNAATAAGTPPVGPALVTPPSDTDSPLAPAASISLQKTADVSALGTPPRAGDVVHYSFTSTNTGNVTLTGVAIADPLPGLSALAYTWPGAPGTLSPGQAVTATASYQLTQRDLDAGVVDNTATVSGAPPSGPDATGSAQANVPLATVPDLALQKTADISALGSPPKAGDSVTYAFTATNTGDVTLTGVDVDDPLPGLSAPVYAWPGAAGILEPGQTVTAIATYRLAQPDIDAGHVANAATASGTPPTGPAVTTPPADTDSPLSSGPAITLVKTADTSAVQSPPRPGDTITFDLRSTNTGNVTLTGVAISDALPGLSALSYSWPGAPGVLEPGQSVTATATYQLTQPDIDAGAVSNGATVSGTPPTGAPVADASSTAVALAAAPALSFAKAADDTQLGSTAVAGNTIIYLFNATNTGNVTLSNVSVVDALPGLGPVTYVWPGTPGVLAPGEQVTASATYQITQGDLDAGHVANHADATATDLAGAGVTAPSADTDTPLAPAPSLVLVKTADTSGISTPARAGDVVGYGFAVTNTGNVTVTGVAITDPLPGLPSLAYAWPGAPGVLAPGEQATATASYPLTQADVDAGHVANQATAAGSPPAGADVMSPPADTDTPLAGGAGIALTKTADISGVSAPPRAGNVVVYHFIATNSGTVTLTGVAITDPLPGLPPLTYAWPGAAGVLAPGEQVAASASYALTQADVDAGQLANTATVVGTPPSGPDVTVGASAPTVPLPRAPGITLAKSADTTGLGTPVRAGDGVEYGFTMTNTGNVTLTGVAVTDALPGLQPVSYVWPGAPGVLAPGEQATGTAAYAVTQADVDAGHVTNQATAAGSPPAGPDIVSPPADTDTPLAGGAGISLVKTADASGVSAPPKAGDVVVFRFTATNSGNVTLTGVAIADPLPGLPPLTYAWPGLPGVLAPGQAVTASASYPLSQGDVDAGVLANSATVEGTPPSGPPVTAGASSPDVDLPASPGIRLRKFADASGVGSPARAGDVVQYTFIVNNTGNVTLSGVAIADPLPGLPPLTYVWPGAPGVLGPNEAVVASASYPLSQADVDAGLVANSATVEGTPPSGPPVTAAASSPDVPLPASPGIALVKTADASGIGSPARAGDVVVYRFAITNTGNVTVSGVAVSDALPGLPPVSYVWPGAPGVLAPGEQATGSASYVVTQTDVDAGHVANQATVAGSPPSGPDVVSPPADTDTPLAPAPAIALMKTVSPSDPADFVAGRTATYTFVVANTGNVTLANPRVVEGAFSGSGTLSPVNCPPTPQLLPGDQMVCTATYVLTTADIAAGGVSNTATATATPPAGGAVDSAPVTVTNPAPAASGITLNKTADTSAVGSPAAVGDSITYHFTARNSGNVALTAVTIDDVLPGLSALSYQWPGVPGTLQPGGTVQATATYRLTQADLDAGHVTNTATATGAPPAGPDVMATSSVSTVVPVIAALEIVKTADTSQVGTPASPGDLIGYRFTVRNTGTVTLSAVAISDQLPGLSAIVYAWPGEPGVLAPGAQMTATATYSITPTDLAAGHVSNSATATGVRPAQGILVGSPPAVADSFLPFAQSTLPVVSG